MEVGTEWSITVDCRPGAARPSDLLAPILDGVGLSLREDFLVPACFFGQWTFEYRATPDRPTPGPEVRQRVGEALTELHRTGAIRYADW